MNRLEDLTLLLAPVSIKNLKEVPLIDASANQSIPKVHFQQDYIRFRLCSYRMIDIVQ